MLLDEETLQGVAQNGEMEYSKWPAIVEPLLERIDYIVYTEFSIPRPYPNINRPSQILSPQQSHLLIETLQTSTPIANGPTIPATPTPTRNLPPVPLFPSTSSNNTPSTSQIPDSLPPTTQPLTDRPPELPAPLVQLLDGITKTLRNSFSTLPPHTIQRFAELILHPTMHYRTLPAWLRAVDRAISVTSTADIFPLPRALPLPSHVIDCSLLTNGVHGESDKGVLGEGGGGILWLNEAEKWNEDDGTVLGSDESLGGALLTPIPWLRNGVVAGSSSEESNELESSESDDMLGGPIELPSTTAAAVITNLMVPERENGAVTQGELIRQEQEAGVVPVGHSSADSAGMLLDEDDEIDEETPHARGPGVMGAVDVGMVNGKGMEVNVGNNSHIRRREGSGAGLGVRDAQEVLRGGDTGRTFGGQTAPDEDEMQVDATLEGMSDPEIRMRGRMAAKRPGMDEDTVLTDVDARTEEGIENGNKEEHVEGKKAADMSASSGAP